MSSTGSCGEYEALTLKIELLLARVKGLRSLCQRAADALERKVWMDELVIADLIAELREAGK